MFLEVVSVLTASNASQNQYQNFEMDKWTSRRRALDHQYNFDLFLYPSGSSETSNSITITDGGADHATKSFYQITMVTGNTNTCYIPTISIMYENILILMNPWNILRFMMEMTGL